MAVAEDGAAEDGPLRLTEHSLAKASRFFSLYKTTVKLEKMLVSAPEPKISLLIRIGDKADPFLDSDRLALDF